MSAEPHTFEDDGGIPNSRLPVLIYHRVEGAADASACERLFASNGWEGAWRDGIYSFHHFHSTSHEVLGIVRGSASVTLGGPAGRTFEVRQGDVLVLPAGTGRLQRRLQRRPAGGRRLPGRDVVGPAARRPWPSTTKS